MLKDAKGRWTAHSMMTSNEGSLGAQLGGKNTFLVMLLMTDAAKGMLTNSVVDFGGEAGGTGGNSSGGVALMQFKDVTIEELPPTPGAPTWESLGGVEAARKLAPPAPKKAAPTKSAAAPDTQATKTGRDISYNASGVEAQSPEDQRQSFKLPPGFEIELVAAKSEGIGKFVAVDWNARGDGVEAEVELIFPAEFKARLAQRVVAVLRAGMALGEVGGVRGDLVGDDAVFHVFLVRQAEVFLGCDVTKHRTAIPADHRRADAAGDVVVTQFNLDKTFQIQLA
jgi:hypothetical protein